MLRVLERVVEELSQRQGDEVMVCERLAKCVCFSQLGRSGRGAKRKQKRKRGGDKTERVCRCDQKDRYDCDYVRLTPEESKEASVYLDMKLIDMHGVSPECEEVKQEVTEEDAEEDDIQPLASGWVFKQPWDDEHTGELATATSLRVYVVDGKTRRCAMEIRRDCRPMQLLLYANDSSSPMFRAPLLSCKFRSGHYAHLFAHIDVAHAVLEK